MRIVRSPRPAFLNVCVMCLFTPARMSAPHTLLVLPSCLESVDRLDEFVHMLIREHGMSDDAQGNILISLTEAVTNAIRHGNALDVDKEVRIDVYTHRDKLRIAVTDEGPGFEPTTVPDPTAPEFLEREGGRGVFLMRALSDEIAFSKHGRCVEMCYEYGVKVRRPLRQTAAVAAATA